MKNWNELSETEKVNAYNYFVAVVQNVQSKYSSNASFCENIDHKIKSEKDQSYRDYIILWLFDKGYSVNDGFRFFNAVGLKLTQEDMFSILCEKLDISLDELLGALISPLNASQNGRLSVFDDEMEKIRIESDTLFQDIKLRLGIFVEVHNIEFQKQNPEKYIELLNSPITSLLSIKLSKNERIMKALKKRIKASK